MSDKPESSSGKISQEILAIIGMGVLILVSLFAGYNTLTGKIDTQATELRGTMNEANATLRRERREDVRELREEIRKMRDGITNLTQTVNRLVLEIARDQSSTEARINAVERQITEGNDG